MHAPTSRPLRGATIFVTRPRRRAAELARRLRDLGARVVCTPLIRVAPPASWRRLDEALRSLEAYDAVVFTSANGVASFFDRAATVLRGRPRRPGRLYAIGPATARELARRGWRGVRVPERHEGAALARSLGAVAGRRILLPRAAVARELLPRALRRAGARVDVVHAYRTVSDLAGRRILARALRRGGADLVTFTSASTVEEFFASAGRAHARRFLRGRAASIGPVTGRALRSRGAPPVVEARTSTAAGLAAAIARWSRSRAPRAP